MHRTLSDFILELVQNALEAGARTIEVSLHTGEGWCTVEVRDDGKGMTPEEKERALDPFFTDGRKHPARRLGLGLAFLKQAVDLVGGGLSLESEPGRGTVVRFTMPLDHVDTPPMGDLASTWRQALSFDGDYELVVERRGEGGGYTLSRKELLEELGDFWDASHALLLDRFVHELEDSCLNASREGDVYGKDDAGTAQEASGREEAAP
ncbi:ATP-binding protein [Spirochaeta thermophila]|uniref:histidine kinase n=1 Tax=Winmispira thermophila (strain ATCC 49972 / DSM 6192 / RI 19.B1) TaxID=665571 RepID=E0RU96_WINT6|nr:ATP-binding protein [Spirochaeta thermophila]ADN02317.1 histidine kinase [Spirochaeta thermophila DSM 6192]